MTAGPSTPSSPQSWVSHSLPNHRAGGAFCSLARELRAFLPHIPAAQSPPCCPAPAQPVPGTRSSASTAGEHPARAPCSLPWLWQAGGTAGGSEGSVLPRQQLHIPQGLQKFPLQLSCPRSCTPQPSFKPGCCLRTVRGPCPARLCWDLFQTQGVLGTTGAAGESQPSGVPWDSKRDLALQS